MKRYVYLWWKLTSYASQVAFSSRLGALFFIIGKIVRFFLFLAFLILLGTKTNIIAGYSLNQMIIFFLTFNLIDTLPQFFFREVYRFRQYVVTGDFDYFLLRPLSPLFRSLFGGSDVFDLSILLLSVIFIIIVAIKLPAISLLQISMYVLLILNAFLIAMSLHIIILSLAIMTTEIDNALMLYRDLTQMGRIPIDVYKEPIRGILTFIIPVGIMITFPTKVLLGILSLPLVMVSYGVSLMLFGISILFWRHALKLYASASS